MRVDKFLKNSRLIKRRTIAKEACEKGRIFVNGKEAKPGTEVNIDDEIQIVYGDKSMKVIVEEISEHVSKNDSNLMYRIIK